jgi:UDPglucose 6-dehydrogenase
LRDLYAPIITQTFAEPSFLPRPAGLREVPLLVTALTSAEMIKYASNAFLATKIGFANEMANLCERVGADIKEVVLGLGLDSRIGPSFLNPGLGWGGSCFGKDIRNLLHTAYEYGFQSRILEAALDVNAAQRCLAIQKLLEKLFILKGRTIALLGLAFKPDTDDLRDAPSLQIAVKLTQMGARVRAYDPIAMKRCQQQHPELEIEYCSSAEGAAENAHAIVVVTEWPEFACLDLAGVAHRMAIPVLIDGRNIYNPHDAIAAGFDYAGIGRRKARRAVDKQVSMRQPAYELAVGASRAS